MTGHIPAGCEKHAEKLDMRRLKVLVVDDEPELADVAGALMSAYGIANRIAYSAADALSALADDPAINAVFSDIMMPEATGIELAQAVKRLYPTVRIVLTSGYTAPELAITYEAFCLYTPKPYLIETVIDLLRR